MLGNGTVPGFDTSGDSVLLLNPHWEDVERVMTFTF